MSEGRIRRSLLGTLAGHPNGPIPGTLLHRRRSPFGDTIRIIGHGVDLVDTARVTGFLANSPDFYDGWLTEAELEESRQYQDLPRFLSGRIAAKEAVAKALGTGFNEAVSWQDIEVSTLPTGAPAITLTGGAAAVAKAVGIVTILVSLSHLESMTLASAIALGR